jgi:hypothetical protein
VEPGLRLQTLRTQTGEISRITLTGGAAQSAAVRAIALAVFGLPIAATEPFESVAVGAAKQAAWALSGTMLDWPVPYASEQEPTAEDVAAAQEINARYESVLQTHFLRRRVIGFMARTDLSLAERVEYRPAVAEPSDFDTFWADTLETTAGIDLAVSSPPSRPPTGPSISSTQWGIAGTEITN